MAPQQSCLGPERVTVCVGGSGVVTLSGCVYFCCSSLAPWEIVSHSHLWHEPCLCHPPAATPIAGLFRAAAGLRSPFIHGSR